MISWYSWISKYVGDNYRIELDFKKKKKSKEKLEKNMLNVQHKKWKKQNKRKENNKGKN